MSFPPPDPIPDEELLRRAVKNAQPWPHKMREARWVSISRQFALGSTYSRLLCRRFGLDPDEELRRK